MSLDNRAAAQELLVAVQLMTKEQKIRLVRELLQANPPKGSRSRLWKTAPAKTAVGSTSPSLRPKTSRAPYEYDTVLTDIEEHLRERERVDVLLVPAG
jgi:hypothetical protein